MKILILSLFLSQMTLVHASAESTDSLSSLVGQWLVQKDGITDSVFTMKWELIFKNGEVLKQDESTVEKTCRLHARKFEKYDNGQIFASPCRIVSANYNQADVAVITFDKQCVYDTLKCEGNSLESFLGLQGVSADNVRYQIHTQFELKKFGKELTQFLESKNNVDHYTRLSGDWQSNDKTVGLRFIGGEEYPASTQIDKTIDVLSGEAYYHATPKAAGRFKTTAYLIDQQSREHRCDEVESSQSESFGAEFHFYIPDSGQEAFRAIACKQESATALVCLLGVRGFYGKIDLTQDFKIMRFNKQNSKSGFTEKLDQLMEDDLTRVLRKGNQSNHQAEQVENTKNYQQWKKPLRNETSTKELFEVWEEATAIEPSLIKNVLGIWEGYGWVELRWIDPNNWMKQSIQLGSGGYIAFVLDAKTGWFTAYDDDQADLVSLKTNPVTKSYSARATWIQFKRKVEKNGFRHAYHLGCRYSSVWDRLLCLQMTETTSESNGTITSTGYEPYHLSVYRRSNNESVKKNMESIFGITLN